MRAWWVEKPVPAGSPAGTLPEGTHVVCFAGEHHANLLPWKRIGVRYLPVPESPVQMLETLEETLRDLPHCADPHLVAVTGASNVTGEVWPLAEIAREPDAPFLAASAGSDTLGRTVEAASISINGARDMVGPPWFERHCVTTRAQRPSSSPGRDAARLRRPTSA